MKKTISITLGGIVFAIEEDAYQVLDRYLQGIRQKFSAEVAVDEIIADIEASIADKFSKKITSRKQTIAIDDVQEVIAIMGEVDEMAEDITEEAAPQEPAEREAPKRLYRNPDDTIIAGVCSGLAAYFGIDPVYVRVVFIVLALGNGIGILIYLVLWLIVPKAESRTQKLEMHGKPATVHEITEAVKSKSKMVQEEGKAALSSLRNRSALYTVLNFPIKVLDRIVSFLKRILRVLGPTLSVVLGVLIVLCSLAVLLFISITGGFMLFHLDSPHIISDIPLQELTTNPLYYLEVILVYLVALVPVVFLILLGLTLIRRKNMFSALASGIVLSVWMVIVASSVVVAFDVVPQLYNRVEELKKEETITREFDVTDFSSVAIHGDHEVTIEQGDAFSFTAEGRMKDLDRFAVTVEDGVLSIEQTPRITSGKLCFFCFDEEVEGRLVMPSVKSITTSGVGHTTIQGFSGDIGVTVEDSSHVMLTGSGQNATTTLKGSSGLVELSGVFEKLVIEAESHARVRTEDIAAVTIQLLLLDHTRVSLKGEAEELTGELFNHSRLYAEDLQADNVELTTDNHSRAEVWPQAMLSATARGYSSLYYQGDPELTRKEEYEHSSILPLRTIE